MSMSPGLQLLSFPGGPPLPRPLRSYEECRDPRDSRVVAVSSFSKILAPALRLG